MTLYLAQADRVRAGSSRATCPHFYAFASSKGDSMKNQLLVALTLAITTPLTNAIAMVLGLYDGNILQFTWPAFFVAVMYLIGGEKDVRGAANIYCAGATGLLWGILCATAIGYLAGIVGPIAGMALGLGGTIFVYVALMHPLPMFFNNYGVMFYLTSCLFVTQMTVEWMLVDFIGGIFYMVITFGLVKLLTKIPLISLKSK